CWHCVWERGTVPTKASKSGPRLRNKTQSYGMAFLPESIRQVRRVCWNVSWTAAGAPRSLCQPEDFHLVVGTPWANLVVLDRKLRSLRLGTKGHPKTELPPNEKKQHDPSSRLAVVRCDCFC